MVKLRSNDHVQYNSNVPVPETRDQM